MAAQKELTIRRTFKTPRIILWKLWTDPEQLARWWGPKGFTNPLCEIEPRTGGTIRIDMRSPEGILHPLSGKVLEIQMPSLLVFTSSPLDKNGNPLFNVTNTITMVEEGGNTALLMHAGLSDSSPEAEPYLAGMEEGWKQSLDRLEDTAVHAAEQHTAGSFIALRWLSLYPYFQSILRIVAAIMFMLAGTVKLFAFPAGMPPNGGTVELISQMGLGGILETFGGALLILGLYTRPVAFILSGEMAVAYFQFHFPGGAWPVLNGGVAAVLYCFLWLYFSSAGAGPWSLDAKRGK